MDRQRSIRPMTFEQLSTFLEAAEQFGSRQESVLFLTLADTGIRPGESLALKWEDVDTAGRTLRIERALSEGHIKSTKTEEPRTVDLTQRLADALAGWQSHIEAEALTSNARPSEYLFTDAGLHLRAPDVARQFQSLLRRAGLPKFRLYDLRHSYAAQLLKSGAPITYVADQLGHSKPTTTLLFYAHWLPDGDKAYIDRLEAIRTSEKLVTSR
jgi:integrase